MKILYLTPNFSNFYAALYDGMIQSPGRYADLTLYGPGYELFNELENERDMLKVVDILGKPDVIMMWDHQGTGWAGDFYNLDKVDCLKVLWSVDIHKDANSPKVLSYVKDSDINLILMSYDKKLQTEAGRAFKALNIPTELYPFSIDPEFYKPLGIPKRWDVSVLGNIASSYYPYRNAFASTLRSAKGLLYHDPESNGRFFREEFVKHINECKICVTCSSSYKYALPKYFEAMACGSLLLADKPMDSDILHFIPSHNFVEVDPTCLLEKVMYYLEHQDEAKRIAQNARETILNFHTNKLRGRQLVEILAEYR